MKKQVVTLLLAVLAILPPLSAQSKKEKEQQQKENVQKQIASGRYTVEVNTALPMRGSSIPLTSSYSMTIRNDSVISYLPYYGRAYQLPYGGGEGLRFSAPITDYAVKQNKKKNVSIITFSTRTNEDSFDFRVEVYVNSSASINVTMQNRQPIGFLGEIIGGDEGTR